MVKYSFSPRELQSVLHGFLCIFKPRDASVSAIEKLLLNSICEQANCLDPNRPLPVVEMPIVQAHPQSGALMVVGKRKQIDYSKHPLMVGQMFRPEDMRIEALNYLEPSSSGVCLFGLNNGCDRLEDIRDRAWLSEYILDGELGRETVDHNIRGKVNARAEYDHVSLHQMNRVLSMVRMQFKKASFQFANTDLQSQEAFELARRGAPRPRILGSPLVYELTLGQFKPPHFRLHVYVTGETNKFMRELLHELGCCLNTVACPRRVRRVRQGCFTLDHALLDKHFQLESIVRNLWMSTKMVNIALEKHDSDVIGVKPESQIQEEHEMVERYRLTDRWTEPLVEEEEDSLRLPWGRDYIFVS